MISLCIKFYYVFFLIKVVSQVGGVEFVALGKRGGRLVKVLYCMSERNFLR